MYIRTYSMHTIHTVHGPNAFIVKFALNLQKVLYIGKRILLLQVFIVCIPVDLTGELWSILDLL